MNFLKKLNKMPVIVILGATGAGKSKLALEIASKYNGEIISADSMQVYKELDIITNKVTAEEQAMCKHHLLDYVDPLYTQYTVTDFRDAALPIIERLLTEKKIPVVVGGTNYYIESLLWHFVLQPSDGKNDAGGANCSSDSDSGSDTGAEQKNIISPRFSPDRDRNSGVPTLELHRQLTEVDPEMARRLHPNNRRKIIRALEVYAKHGRRMSQVLQEQHGGVTNGAVSGPLRYNDVHCIWVQAQQDVLDDRINRRVDDMISRGLLSELTAFHMKYNTSHIQQNQEADYTHGIFQSIGFKEFHDYLVLPEEERLTPQGQKLFNQGKEQLQLVTRRYARKQLKWINNRFLKRQGEVPAVYGVDSTHPSQWLTDAQKPAFQIMDAVLRGEKPCVQPLPCVQAEPDQCVHNVCHACDKIFVTKTDWQAHLKSRRHNKRLAKLKHQDHSAEPRGNTADHPDAGVQETINVK